MVWPFQVLKNEKTVFREGDLITGQLYNNKIGIRNRLNFDYIQFLRKITTI